MRKRLTRWSELVITGLILLLLGVCLVGSLDGDSQLQFAISAGLFVGIVVPLICLSEVGRMALGLFLIAAVMWFSLPASWINHMDFLRAYALAVGLDDPQHIALATRVVVIGAISTALFIPLYLLYITRHARALSRSLRSMDLRADCSGVEGRRHKYWIYPERNPSSKMNEDAANLTITETPRSNG